MDKVCMSLSVSLTLCVHTYVQNDVFSTCVKVQDDMMMKKKKLFLREEKICINLKKKYVFALCHTESRRNIDDGILFLFNGKIIFFLFLPYSYPKKLI